MRRKFKMIGQILIVVSLACCLFYNVYNYFKEEKEVEIADNYIEETKAIDDEEIITENDVQKKESIKKEINYTAVIEIPSVNLKRGVVDSTSNFNSINYAISVDKNSNYPDKEGNFILYAHSGNSSISYFKNLNKVEINDEVYIYYNGVKYEYKIFDKYDIEKTGKAEVYFTNTEKYITLITCSQEQKNRQIVLIGNLKNEKRY